MNKDQIGIRVNALVFNKLIMIAFGFLLGLLVGGVIVYYATDQDSDDYIRGFTDGLEQEIIIDAE
jgi:hypothetical protein